MYVCVCAYECVTHSSREEGVLDGNRGNVFLISNFNHMYVCILFFIETT